jgi:thiamine pyrophosphokinase
MKHYNFKNKKFDAVICLNGEIPEQEVFDSLVDIPLIAADGAYNRLYSLGINPNAIVGDMDSVTEKHNTEHTEFIEIPNQNTNDFEKCVRYAQQLGYRNILIIGFTGGLLEHTVNNISIIIKFTREMNIIVYHQHRYCYYITNDIELNIKKDELVSLIPYPSAKLKTRGLNWELHSEELQMGIREGARNFAITDNIKIELLSGSYLLFIDSRLPYGPD